MTKTDFKTIVMFWCLIEKEITSTHRQDIIICTEILLDVETPFLPFLSMLICSIYRGPTERGATFVIGHLSTSHSNIMFSLISAQ